MVLRDIRDKDSYQDEAGGEEGAVVSWGTVSSAGRRCLQRETKVGTAW